MTRRSQARRALGLAGALALAPTFFACGGGEGPGGGGGGFRMPPTPVEVAEVSTGEMVDRFDAVGTFEAVLSVSVVSEVSGIVRELPFREGEPVRRGSLLARLEDTELAASLARAEAVVERTQNSYERVRAVVERNAAAPQDLDDALADLRVAEADAALARARLEKTRIRAPFDGHVGPRLVSDGAFLVAGQPITTLIHLEELEVVFNAPERYLPRLVVDADVAVSTPAYPELSVEGRIAVVDPQVDPATRTVEVIARVPNPGLRFRPGMSADVDAVLSRKADALTIPSAAVFAQGAETLVFVVGADSTVQRTPVVLGTRLAAVVEVVEGLSAGQSVVKAGHQKLFPGAKVMPIPSGGAAGGPGAGGPGGPGAAGPSGAGDGSSPAGGGADGSSGGEGANR